MRAPVLRRLLRQVARSERRDQGECDLPGVQKGHGGYPNLREGKQRSQNFYGPFRRGGPSLEVPKGQQIWRTAVASKKDAPLFELAPGNGRLFLHPV